MHVPATDPLPHAAPANPHARLLLFAVRRMAAGGIGDAHAAHAFFGAFGLAYRRPLVLVRALIAEVSRVSAVRLRMAPCCCHRMSEAEHRLIGAVICAGHDPQTAHATLVHLLHVRNCLGLVTTAQAVAACFADNARPLDTDCRNCNLDEPL